MRKSAKIRDRPRFQPPRRCTATKAPAYDAGGNMVADGALVFAYNGLNRLIRVEKA